MARKETIPTEEIITYINKKKAVSFHELVSEFQCSYMTILRKKENIGYITSYNKYNSGMTLINIPKFNEFGIWECPPYLFSKWGDMKMTIKGIIDNSAQGLYASELQKIMKVRVNNHLSECTSENLIMRNHEFGHPIYFSTEKMIKKLQYEQSKILFEKRRPAEISPLSKENIIKILIAIIEHHAINIEKLMNILRTKGLKFSRQSLKWLFDRYEIEKKGSP
jgi:hypothetical protein